MSSARLLGNLCKNYCIRIHENVPSKLYSKVVAAPYTSSGIRIPIESNSLQHLALIDLFIVSWYYLQYGGALGGASGKESSCQCRRCKRHRFNPWVRKIPWRKAWQSTPVILLGESHGHRSPVGYGPWGCKELVTTEAT